MIIETVHELLIAGHSHQEILLHVPFLEKSVIEGCENYQRNEFETNCEILENMLTDQAGNSDKIWDQTQIRATQIVNRYKRFDPERAEYLLRELKAD